MVRPGKQVLTADEWHRVQFVPPRVCNFDGFAVVEIFLGLHALLVGMRNEVLHVLVLHRVRDIPEVDAIG